MYLSRRFARVDISFIGDEERLIRALEQKDLLLSPSALSGWELRLSSRVFGDSEPLFPPEPETMPAEDALPEEMSFEEMPAEEMMEELDGSAADSAPSDE